MSLFEELDKLELVAEEGEYDYSWSIVRVYYDAAQRIYYWFDDSGCSCSSWADSVASLMEFENGRKDDVIRGLKDGGYDDAVEAVRKHRPEGAA